jgi:hypothetical protein
MDHGDYSSSLGSRKEAAYFLKTPGGTQVFVSKLNLSVEYV